MIMYEALKPGDRFEHRKGGTYAVIGTAKVQTDTPLADYAEVVVYRSEGGGHVWVRPVSEFSDGRFASLGQAHGACPDPQVLRTIADRLRGPATEAAKRLINAWFGNEGERPRIGIPARPDYDDDLVLVTALKDAAFALEAAGAESARLRRDIQRITCGDVPRDCAVAWRNDGQPSKYDRCEHDVPMHDDCSECIAAFASRVILDDAAPATSEREVAPDGPAHDADRL